jgi:formate dehydrogenase major subunit
VPGLGTLWGRGGATMQLMDLQFSDLIIIQGSNFAENHPVGFRFVTKARERGATIVHVDPRFTRTSAMATKYLPLRSGTDIAFTGGIINYVLQNEAYFKEFVLAYTTASFIVREDFQDTEDLDGVFSGFNAEDL